MAVTVSFDAVNLKSEFGTNTHTLADQLAPDALGLSNGGFVVAYNNTSIASGLILLDFYDAAFQSVGAVSIPFDDSATSDAAGEPSVTELANGTVLVVWDEQNDTGSQAGIKGALFEQDGTLIDAGIDLENGGIPYKDIDVTALSNGNFAVSFALASFEMFQLYTSAGVQIGGAHIMNQVTAGTQRDAQIVALRDGGFAAVWTDLNTANLKARVFENDGAPRTDEFAIHAFSGKSQVALAATPDGGWVAAYRDTAWGEPGAEGAGITLHRYDDSSGGFSPIQVTDQTVPDESDPDVTVLSNGFILVTWTRPTGASNSDIMGRMFDQDGNAVAINGVDGEFVITASASNDTLSSVAALAAGQFITAWQDAVTLDGSGGRITSEIAEVVRTSLGDAARDTIIGDSLRDSMDGGRGADTLNGADANDTLRGGDGEDSLRGGLGDDLLAGEDRDDVIVAGDGADIVEGGGGKDFIVGGAGDDVIYAATQAEPGAADAGGTISGDDGDDVLIGASGRDTLNAGGGDNTIQGGNGGDFISGGFGRNLLDGEGGDDRLSASVGQNTMNGGAGDDTLQGGFQEDVLNGGDGNDEIRTSDPSPDTIDGGLGVDKLYYGGLGGSIAVRVDLSTGLGAGGANDDTIQGIEILFGGSGDDTLIGSVRGDQLDGEIGDDLVQGGDGKDALGGIPGGDSSPGASGDDTLIGGKDGDLLTGEGGADRFVYLSLRDSFDTTGKRDHILDFSASEGDRIDLSALDARAGGANNAFTFVAAFTGAAGQLIAPPAGSDRFLVQGDVDGDGVADFAILVESAAALSGADFVP